MHEWRGCAGLHANSGLWRPAPDSHRIALVLYQTELREKRTEPVTPGSEACGAGGDAGAGSGAAEVETELGDVERGGGVSEDVDDDEPVLDSEMIQAPSGMDDISTSAVLRDI